MRNERYECIPAIVWVEQIIDAIWECPKCHDAVVVAPETCEPIPGGTAGPRLLVKIAEDRWLNHLPLHRQEQMFARLGVDISRSTMCGWMAALATTFRSVYDRMKEELLKSKIIATDDSPVKVQDRTKKSNIKRGHEWIFMGDKEHPVNLFHYTKGRSRSDEIFFLDLKASCREIAFPAIGPFARKLGQHSLLAARTIDAITKKPGLTTRGSVTRC